MNTAPVRLALIGLGNMGSAHLEIFTGLEPHARISALADSHAPFAERASAQVPAAAVFCRYQALNSQNTP